MAWDAGQVEYRKGGMKGSRNEEKISDLGP